MKYYIALAIALALVSTFWIANPFVSVSHAHTDSECKSALSDTMHDMKDLMRTISRNIKKNQLGNSMSDIDKMLVLIDDATKLSPQQFDSLTGDELLASQTDYTKYLDELTMTFNELKTATQKQALNLLQQIKDIQRKSHRQLKDC